MKTFFILFILSIALVNITNAQTDGTVEVGAGWNMIGSPSDGLVSAMVRSEPPGIIVSPFYGYNPGGGYEAKDTLKKGAAYWAKVNSDGMIIFGTGVWSCGNPIDYAGKSYNTVQIGSQCWIKENLDVGTRINVSQNSSDDGTIEKYCYRDDPANCIPYGGLYQWNEAMQYTTAPGAKGICPTGWHIPTQGEFETLKATVASNGNALKASGQGIGDGYGTNASGYSALLAGVCNPPGGGSSSLWTLTRIWGSLESTNSGYLLNLANDNSTIFLGYTLKSTGNSVRCIKD